MPTRPRCLGFAGLDVRLEFLQFRRVLTGMVLAEQQFTTGRQDCPDACGGAAPIATVGSGQLRAGKCAGHDFSFRPGQASATGPGRTVCATHGMYPSTRTSNRRTPLLQTIAVLDVFPMGRYLSDASTALWGANAQG